MNTEDFMLAITRQLTHADLYSIERSERHFFQSLLAWGNLIRNARFILHYLASFTDESNRCPDTALDYCIQDARQRCLAIRGASLRTLLELLFIQRGDSYISQSCDDYRELTYSVGLICSTTHPELLEMVEQCL